MSLEDLPMLEPIADDDAAKPEKLLQKIVSTPEPEPVIAKTEPVAELSPIAVNIERISQPPGCAIPIAIIAASLIVSLAILFGGSGNGGSQPVIDDQQLIDDGGDSVTPQPDEVVSDLSGCLLIVIADGDLVNREPDYAATLQDDAFWDAVAARVKDVEFLAPTDDIAKKFLAVAGKQPPIVALIKPDKHPAWLIPLPKNGTKTIQEKLDGR